MEINFNTKIGRTDTLDPKTEEGFIITQNNNTLIYYSENCSIYKLSLHNAMDAYGFEHIHPDLMDKFIPNLLKTYQKDIPEIREIYNRLESNTSLPEWLNTNSISYDKD